jgi:hypothetical protein
LAPKDPEITFPVAEPWKVPGGFLGGCEQDVLAVRWAGAAAPNATIRFVAVQSTYSTDGAQLAVQHILDHNLAPIMTYAWDFGDGATAEGISCAHAFQAQGPAPERRLVTFTATDGMGGSCSDTRTVKGLPGGGGGLPVEVLELPMKASRTGFWVFFKTPNFTSPMVGASGWKGWICTRYECRVGNRVPLGWQIVTDVAQACPRIAAKQQPGLFDPGRMDRPVLKTEEPTLCQVERHPMGSTFSF